MTTLLDRQKQSTLSDDDVWTYPAATPRISSQTVSTSDTASYCVAIERTLSRVTASVDGFAPRATDLIRPLLELRDGWDGYGALAPTPVVLKVAAQFLSAIVDVPLPTVTPSVSGGILLEWESSSVDLVIEIRREGGAEVFVRSGENEKEGPLETHLRLVLEALSALRLSQR